MCVAIFLLMACVYALSTGGHVYSVDEETMLATSRALAHGHRELQVDDTNRHVLITREQRPGERVGQYGLGTSIVALPMLGAGTLVADASGTDRPEVVVRLFVLWTNSLLTAAAVVLVFVLALEIGASSRGALLLAFAYGLGTFAWVHAKTLFSEPGTSVCLLTAVWLAVRGVRTEQRAPWIVSGMAGGASLLFRVSAAVGLPVLFVFAVVASRGLPARAIARRVGWLSAGTAMSMSVLALVNWWRFGSPTTLGYPHLPYTTPLPEGAFGLLFSPGKGLAWYAPAALLALAVPFVARTAHQRHVAWLASALTLSYLILFGRYFDWSGGDSWGPRYLQPVTPVLVAALAVVVDEAPWRRLIVRVAVLGGALTLVTGVATYFNAVAWRDSSRLQAELGQRPNEQSREAVRARAEATRWTPRESPIVLAVRYLPEAVRNTAEHLGGPRTPLPDTEEQLVHYYDDPLRIDTWWAWWRRSGGWPPLLLLVPVLTAGAVIGGTRLQRLVHAGHVDDARIPQPSQ